MKRIIASILLVVFCLAGCEDLEDDGNSVSNTIIMTDTEIVKMKEENLGRGGADYLISYQKGSNKSNMINIPYNTYKEIKNIKKTEKMMGNKEPLFDITTDGEHIFTISLSKNRK